jgi:competence protein ComEA
MIFIEMIIGKPVRACAIPFAIFLGLVFALSAPAGKTDDSASRSSVRSELIDINHATASELRTLPGIRDAYAAAIVKNRPYKNKAQLLSKQVIPEAAYGKIRKKIIARQ